MAGENRYCPYCASTDFVRFGPVWKCNECGRYFVTPITSLIQTEETTAPESGKDG